MIDDARMKAIPLFSRLQKEQREVIANIATVRQVKKGDVLFKAGDLRSSFFVVLSGAMHVYRQFEDEVQTLAILGKNEFAVETALVDTSLKHEHIGEVFEDGELLEISSSAFQEASKQHLETTSRMYAAIIENLSQRLHHANNKIVTIYSTGKIAATYSDIDNLSDLLLTTILEIIRAKRALFVLFDPLISKAVIREAKGYGDDQAMRNLDIPLTKDPILGTLYQSHQNLVIASDQYKRESSLHTKYASRNMLGVPLYVQNRVIGAILLGDKEDNEEFSYNNQILLSIIAKQVVLAVVSAEASEKR